MSVHRYWFSGAQTVTPTPAYDVGWNNTAGAARRLLHTVKDAENNTNITISSAAGAQRLSRQYVGPVPRSGSLSGTFTFVMGFQKSRVEDTAFAQVRLHVFSSDGLTKRGTLFSGTSSGTNLTQSTSNWYSRVISGSLTPVTAQIGDLLVIEVGVRITGTPLGAFSHHVRSNTDTSDLSTTEDVVVSSSNPWIELTIPDIIPPRGRVVAIDTEALVDGSRIRTSREHIDAMVDGKKARIASEYLEAITDGQHARVSGTYLEALVLPRSPLLTAAGDLVYVRRPDGLWEAVWLHQSNNVKP